MVQYKDGKAGQYGMSEARRRFSRLHNISIGFASFGSLLAGVVLGMLLLPYLFKYIPWLSSAPVYAYWTLVFVILFGTVVMTYWLASRLEGPMDRILKERFRYLHGASTEAFIAYLLNNALDNHWHLFNGVAMKGGGDIDHVLVGPGGLFCISTKSSRGLYSISPTEKLDLNRENCDHVQKSQQMAIKLRHWLEARLQSVSTVKSIPWVRPVLAVPFAYVAFDCRRLNVWVLDENNLLSELTRDKRCLSKATIDGCVSVLKDLTGWDQKPNN
jgi:hypothetical protein